MKRLCWIMMLQLFSFIIYAQQYQPAKWQKEKIVFKGYTITLQPSAGGSYGYDVTRGKELVIHQRNNPFTMSPMGLSNKEDAYKVAQWQINNLFTKDKLVPGRSIANHKRSSGPDQHAIHRPALINQPVPKDIAKQLQIQIPRP